ncbi:hypothetical protein Pcinc_033596 [Petrolisthes cinctipes]|uniref:Uncharacterized protein n=1 Tax=Petrolisthes cinctipes TaxID=88211 RepID=A0AAE1ES04_PETCI|nr:hypothetical protein Pcinc_033596 [Petrolisthes cinctipes]
MASFVKFLVLFVLCTGGWCQVYPGHTRVQPVFYTPTTIVVTVTETQLHTLRETSTTDVWVTAVTDVTLTATQLTTHWEFRPGQHKTYTSIVRVTSTPISFVTATVCSSSLITETSAFTSFLTSTETVDLVQSITHIAIAHQVHTVPVVTTQMLHQTIITTVTNIVTTTVTSVTRYGL